VVRNDVQQIRFLINLHDKSLKKISRKRQTSRLKCLIDLEFAGILQEFEQHIVVARDTLDNLQKSLAI
jgi:hypothetical protein